MLLYDTFRIRDLDSFQLETEIWPASATTKSPLFFSLDEEGTSFDPFDVDPGDPYVGSWHYGVDADDDSSDAYISSVCFFIICS